MTQTKELRDLAVMTIVQDEPEFIHAWVNHYKTHVAHPRDIFVLIHSRNQTDNEPALVRDIDPWERAEKLLVDYHGVNTLPVHHSSSFDHRWLRQTVESFFSFLLQSYTWVLFAEADEFVLPIPGIATVGQTLLSLVRQPDTDRSSAIRATGFEIVQHAEERPLLPDLYRDGGNVTLSCAQMIQDRGSWYRCARRSKTLLARVPMTWELGFHTAIGDAAKFANGPPSADLALVHLHRVDFDLALNRSRRTRAKNWSQVDVEHRYGWQNRIEDPAELRAFFERDPDTGQPFAPGRREPISQGVKNALRGT